MSQPGLSAADALAAAASSLSSSSSSSQPPATDLQALLAHLVQSQQQLAMYHQQQLEASKASSEQNLARVAAGAAPQFEGRSNDIEAHRWSIAMERWFETAKLIDEKEKVIIAASVMRESAQSWWQSKKDSKEADAIDTWEKFKAAALAQFLPLDVKRWALGELKSLISRSNSDVRAYTSKYYEINQLLKNRDELDRIMDYESGLPADYRAASARKRHTTLKDASEQAVASYNAMKAAGSQHRGASGLHNIETGDWNGGAAIDTRSQSSSSSSSSSPYATAEGYTAQQAATLHNMNTAAPQYVSSLHEQVAQLTAMVAQMQRGGGNRGGSSRGREFNRRGGGNGRAPYRSRSPSWERFGVSKDEYYARMKSRQCFKCGSADHQVGACSQMKQKSTN